MVSAQRSQSQHGTGEMCFIKSQPVGIVTATFPWPGDSCRECHSASEVSRGTLQWARVGERSQVGLLQEGEPGMERVGRVTVRELLRRSPRVFLSE